MHLDGYHPACLLFPKLTGPALDELAADIKDQGLIEPIVLLHDQVLDGKNRLAACQIAGVKPRFIQWDGDSSPIEWVISVNLIRRHLTTSQRAAIAHDLLPLLEVEAKKRQRGSKGRGKKVAKEFATLNGKASEVASRIARTNPRYVETIKRLSQEAPELLPKIRSEFVNQSPLVNTCEITDGSTLFRVTSCVDSVHENRCTNDEFFTASQGS